MPCPVLNFPLGGNNNNNMDNVVCAVYGEGTVFPVQIARGATVSALQKVVASEYKVVSDLVEVQPGRLTLYLARTNGTWLKADDNLEATMQEGDRQFKRMRQSWTLDDEEYFGHEPLPRTKTIHILVDLAAQAAAASSETLPILPGSLHRHPNRLKRWAAINAIMHQKNDDTSECDEAEHIDKKRKSHDHTKVISDLTLGREHIQGLCNFDVPYKLQPSGVPDAAIQLLLDRIVDLRTLYGEVTDGHEAKRLFFIAPILETVGRMLGDARILVEEAVVGKNVLVTGRFEFVLTRGTKRISIVQAEREDMIQGVARIVTGLEALADVEELPVAYGIVTNFSTGGS